MSGPALDGLELPAPMGPGEVRNALSVAGLSQRGAAKILEIDERTMRYYCAGTHPVPRAVQFALYYLVLHIKNPKLV